jgi:lathosterol oxidase
MDLVLEGFDTYLFDPVYASLYPVVPRGNIYSGLNGNASAAGAILGDAPAPRFNNWEYKPASQYLSFQPLSWAYESSWQRDEPLRQFISLFVITWYGTFNRISTSREG